MRAVRTVGRKTMRSYQEALKVVVQKVVEAEGVVRKREEGDMSAEVAGTGKKWRWLDWETNWLHSHNQNDPGRLLWT